MSKFKNKPGKHLTRAMIAEKLDELAALAVALESTIMEWEVWYRLLKNQKTELTQEQWNFVVTDGPIFTDTVGKIMESIRNSMPLMAPPVDQTVPAILGSDGNVVEKEKKSILLDGSGNPLV